MISTEQKKKLLKAKIAVALHDELWRVPKDEEINQVFLLTRVMYKAVILIEAPSPADHRGMLRAGKQCREQGGDLNEILHYPAPILLRHRPTRPYHVRLHPRPG